MEQLEKSEQQLLITFLDEHKTTLKYICIVDEETVNNLNKTFNGNDGIIPFEYKNLIEDLLNITYERKNSEKKIL